MKKTAMTLAVLGVCIAAEPAVASSSLNSVPIDIQVDQYGRLAVSGTTIPSFNERSQSGTSRELAVKNGGCGFYCRSVPPEGQA